MKGRFRMIRSKDDGSGRVVVTGVKHQMPSLLLMIILSSILLVYSLLLSGCSGNSTKDQSDAGTVVESMETESIEESVFSSTDTFYQDSSEESFSAEDDSLLADSIGQDNSDSPDSERYDIPALKGSVSIPNGYYVFAEDIPFTDQMCEDIGVKPDNMKTGIGMLQGQTLIVPADEPYETSEPHIYIKVKEKKYDDITLSDLSDSDYELLATTIVSSFGVTDYETVEGNGLRFIVFTANQGLGNVCRYATILNGHMIYIYISTGDSVITDQQRAVLNYIALSIRHGL